MPPLLFPLQQLLSHSTHCRELCLAPPIGTLTPPGQEQAKSFGGHPVPVFGPPKDAMLYCYIGGGVQYQPPSVSAVVCRVRSMELAVSLLLAARLLSLRGPSQTAVAVTPRNIKAEESDTGTGPRAQERVQEFVQALERAAALVQFNIKSKDRGSWTPQRANGTIAQMLSAGFAGNIGPATAAAAPTASCSSGQ